MSDVILELSESELPDYVNALLEQNRELREENARLEAENMRLMTDAVNSEAEAAFAPSDPGITWREALSVMADHSPTIADYIEKRHGGKI